MGNRGGGRPPAATKAQLRAALREVGAPLLRRAMERAEVDFRAVVVGSKDDRRVQLVPVPIDTRVAILAAQVAAELTESKMAPEKPEATRKRVVEFRVTHEWQS